MKECIFCKIINNEIPSIKVYEDDKILAFKDINPIAPVHIVIIPKKHIESIEEIKDEDAPLVGHIFNTIKTIAKQEKINDSGYRIVSNCGENAGQTVPHIHFHLLGGKVLNWPAG
jgi:histidine triad (HIT) family protein